MWNDRDVVVEHVLGSESNLEIACAVRAHFDAVEGAVRARFLRQLQTSLKESLGSEWAVNIGDSPKYLVVGKKKWVDCRPIVLERDGDKVFIGIPKLQPHSALSEQGEEDLRAGLCAIGESLRKDCRDKWVAWRYVHHKIYSAWNHTSSQTLKDMYFHTSDVVPDFKRLIERWAQAVAPVLDRFYP
jgi:hypothetical protein